LNDIILYCGDEVYPCVARRATYGSQEVEGSKRCIAYGPADTTYLWVTPKFNTELPV